MNDKIKQKYIERYARAKQKGIKFFPDIIYKDLLVAFSLFLLIVGLATFVGVANEPKADPNDSSYIPRPEWYFLFLYELLKYFPGQIEWVGTAVLPGLAILILFLLPFIDRNPNRHWSKRKFAVSVMSVIVIGMIGLTIVSAVTTPPQEEGEIIGGNLVEQIAFGQDVYSIQCVECHGADGEGGEIKGVEGMEGVFLKPISDQDVIYTFTDETLLNIINFGQPIQGMPPFGKAYGGELSPQDMEAIVSFMRYTWDDREEIPEEALQAAAIPTLGPDEVPSYEIHIAPIVKRFCLSCHRPGKENQNYLMGDYHELMTTGDHAPNVIAEDLNSNVIHMLHREEIEAGGPMPPTKALKPELIELWERWIIGGAPETAAEALELTAPSASSTITSTLTISPTLDLNVEAVPSTPSP